MKIKLLAIGKTDEAALRSLIEQYEKRLRHYGSFELLIIPDIKNRKHLSIAQQQEKEGVQLLKKVNSGAQLVLLDERGKTLSSVGFSQYLQKKMNAGTRELVFAIGGPYGFSKAVYQQATGTLSLSSMTFSHQMIRLFMVEQLYRAFTILKNEPYHHE
ncbi:MAG: 23S rRNA (pseudouridine(1915)-N(3))-methyltransferase RlmH [Lutibacter sp.]|nr:23S rRNA (pseudouridine(1915)-N(3))-methyltransferase RlmH [Lutibacter sp.]